MVSRTTPRLSRSIPQWGLSISMELSRYRVGRGAPVRATSRAKPVLVKGRGGRRGCSAAAADEGAGHREINAAFSARNCYYMTIDIQ
jgi:hypothetical protein